MKTNRSDKQDTSINPNQKINLLNRLLFWRELVFLIRQYKETTSGEAVFNIPLQHKCKYLKEKFEEHLNSNRDSSLMKLLFKMFGLEFLMYNLFFVILDISRILQPIFLQHLLSYFSTENKISKKQEYFYANLLILASLLKITFHHHAMYGMQNLGVKVRTTLSSLIYKKSLKLNQTELSKVSHGHVMNLLSNDIEKFVKNINTACYVYLGPLNVLVVLYLTITLLGPTAAVGIVGICTIIPLQMLLAKKAAKYKAKNAAKADERIRLTNEIIEGIKFIKLYSWEKTFSEFVEKIRKSEIQQLKFGFNMTVVGKIYYITLQDVVICLTITVHVLTGRNLTAQYVYVLTTFYAILHTVIGVLFPMGMAYVTEVAISLKRIGKFLELSETEQNYDNTTPYGISLDKINSKFNILTDITLEIGAEELVAITGQVGSGKTTLLQMILHEIPITKGTLYISGKLSYASQDPWIFDGTIKDNILFGEDLNEERYRHVVKACALNYDFSVLAHADETLVGDRGAMLSGGQRTRINLARAVYKDVDFYLLDDPFSALDARVAKHVFDKCIRDFLGNKSVVLVTHNLLFLEEIKTIYFLENGKIMSNGSYSELKKTKLLINKKGEDTEIKAVVEPANYDKENQEVGSVSKKIYQTYFKYGGTVCTTITISFLIVIVQVTKYGSRYFLSFWINSTQENEENGTYLYIYSALVVILIPLSVVWCLKFVRFNLKAAVNLHNKMLTKILDMPMIFFNKNPTGRVINRFSRDIAQIDENLPESMLITIILGSDILSVVIVNIIINPWLFIPTGILFCLFNYFRNIFLNTSRSLKRMEARCRSPLFSHLNTTLHGLTTIRASKTQDLLFEKYEYLQDVYTSVNFTFLACDRCFTFWLDLFCVLYLAITILSFLVVGTEFHGGSVGLSICESLYVIGILQYVIKQWSEMENQMVSVERVIEYSDLESEKDNATKLPQLWPQDGRILFRQVSLRYLEENPFILKSLNFHVSPNEKIGIVGRTGAGKSSLISVLFHLTHFDGDVFIDGINTKTIPLKELRSKISILPQEPTLFYGTIRLNLDPLEEYQDSELWDVLEDVELKDFVSGLPSGLTSKISERGENLSFAQRQLLCLARIILRKNKILVLDEATSNVDPDTDRLIQSKIRERFQDSTVLLIAHKIDTVMHCDKILVMDDGNVVEYDSPANLLRIKNGIFYKLVAEYGKRNEI